MCRDLCVRSIMEAGSASSPSYVRNKCFPNLDAFVRLISLLVKQSGEPSNPTAKINLLNKVSVLELLSLICIIKLKLEQFKPKYYCTILIVSALKIAASKQ